MIDSLVAVAAALAITAFTGTPYILLACLLTPPLLLSSPASRERVLVSYCQRYREYERRWGDDADNAHRFSSLWPAAVAAIRFSAVTLASRVVEILNELARHPLKAMSEIPANWREVVICTPLFRTPELVPGGRSLGDSYGRARIGHVATDARRVFGRARWAVKAQIALLAIVFFPIAFAPPLLFRLSVKASSILWLGFLWEAATREPSSSRYASLDREDRLVARLRVATDTPMARIALIFSFGVLMLFVCKIAGVNAEVPDAVLGSERVADALRDLFLSGYRTAAPWQYASATASLLSLAMFLYAANEVASRDRGGGHSDAAVERTILVFRYATFALFGYIVVCVAYILISALAFVDLPPLERRWFPFAPVREGD